MYLAIFICLLIGTLMMMYLHKCMKYWHLEEDYEKLDKTIKQMKLDETINALHKCPHNEPLHYHHDGCPSCDKR